MNKTICIFTWVLILNLHNDYAIASNIELDETVKIARDAIPEKRTAYIKEVLSLSAEQARQFWPIYEHYTQEMTHITNQSYELLNEYGKAHNEGTMSNQLAEKLMLKHFSLMPQKNQLLKNFCNLLSKEFSPTFAMRFLQAEERMDTIIEYTYQFDIPRVEFK